ncbi:GCN5-related N-acetyltransferase [Amylocystis lapponica]|nr:GCN5-related N-acetyltransferase [Amylocystis lapponica]
MLEVVALLSCDDYSCTVMATCRLREAQEDDLPDILRIFNNEILTSTATFHHDKLDLEERRQWLAKLHDEGYPCIVAEMPVENTPAKRRTIGWCNLSRFRERQAYDASAEITMYVHEDFRGMGLGTGLLARMLEEARESGRNLHTIIAVVSTENTATCRFWEKQRFRNCGVLREAGRKFGRWLDIAMYQLTL